MNNYQPISDLSIIDCLSHDYKIVVAGLTPLTLGADPNAFVYKAQARNQSSYFLKLKRGHHHDISVEILELLQNAGIKQIISPIRTIYGDPTKLIGNFTLIVYPFLQGQDGFSL